MPRVLIAGIGGVGGRLAQRLIVRGTAVHIVARSESRVEALAAELRASANEKGLDGSALVTLSVADLAVEAETERVAREAAAGGALSGFCYSVGSTSAVFFERLRPNALRIRLRAWSVQVSHSSPSSRRLRWTSWMPMRSTSLAAHVCCASASLL
jgi:short-subunit dehydrogenase